MTSCSSKILPLEPTTRTLLTEKLAHLLMESEPPTQHQPVFSCVLPSARHTQRCSFREHGLSLGFLANFLFLIDESRIVPNTPTHTHRIMHFDGTWMSLNSPCYEDADRYKCRPESKQKYDETDWHCIF
jgi:hypothetical protein